MSKCVVYTSAYNAEKTLQRTIDSILSQSDPNFVYYIVDNGSNDSTGKIIHRMAQSDSRIISLRNEKNNVWEPGNEWWRIMRNLHEDDLFCFLDADDIYKPYFLEQMSSYIQENNLDIAACGNDMIDSASGNLLNIRKLSTNLILEGQGFSYYFPLYHQFMRTTWAKMYRVSSLWKFTFSNAKAISYGWDTLFAIENFRNASRIGILAISLHEYYIYKKSHSYQFANDRIQIPTILYKAARNFLQNKCGQVTPRNQDFLLCVYFSDLTDALQILWKAQIPDSKKISHLLVLLESEPMRLLLQADHIGESYGLLPHIKEQRHLIFLSAINWMLALDEVPDELVEGFCQLGELLCASIEEAEKWMCFRNLHIQYLRSVGRTQEAAELE